MLRALAERFEPSLRPADALLRWGGEEFLVVLADTGAKGAYIAAERLRKAIEGSPIRIEEHELSVTVSIGWAAWEGEDPNAWLARADDALYQAKAAGRNTVWPRPLPGGAD